MDVTAIVRSIDETIDHLEKVRSLLTGHIAPLKRGSPPTKQTAPGPKRRMMSAEGRSRIAAAQKKRWAKKK